MLRCTRHTRTIPSLARGKATYKLRPKPASEQAAPVAEPGVRRPPPVEESGRVDAGWTPSQKWAVKPEAVRKRSMWESWAALPANQRLAISLGICAFAVAGMYATDLLEDNLPAEGAEAQPGRKAGLGD